MSFDKIFDLTAGVYYNFHNICPNIHALLVFPAGQEVVSSISGVLLYVRGSNSSSSTAACCSVCTTTILLVLLLQYYCCSGGIFFIAETICVANDKVCPKIQPAGSQRARLLVAFRRLGYIRNPFV